MMQSNRFDTQDIIAPMVGRTLGSNSARLLKALAEENRPVVTVAEAQEILGSSYDAAVQTLGRLVRAGWLVRLKAGTFAIVPLSSGDEAAPEANRYVIAAELVEEAPYYLSHETAMEIHNMLTRPITRVIITTPRRLANREIMGVPYRFVFTSPSTLWGSEPVWVTPYEQVTVSDIERTILDGLARPDLCAGVGQVATGLWMRQDDFSWDKMARYARKLAVGAVAQRLGYLLELLELATPSTIDDLQEMVPTGYARLDPFLPDEGRHLARWRLRLNLEPETLQSVVRT
jgi:predicted transcriptional regulator of viral defense system